MAKNLGHNYVYDHANTETESPFSTRITRFAILRKFKHAHMDSYNGSRTPVDHIRTYQAQMALATKELLCLAFPSTLKGSVDQGF